MSPSIIETAQELSTNSKIIQDIKTYCFISPSYDYKGYLCVQHYTVFNTQSFGDFAITIDTSMPRDGAFRSVFLLYTIEDHQSESRIGRKKYIFRPFRENGIWRENFSIASFEMSGIASPLMVQAERGAECEIEKVNMLISPSPEELGDFPFFYPPIYTKFDFLESNLLCGIKGAKKYAEDLKKWFFLEPDIKSDKVYDLSKPAVLLQDAEYSRVLSKNLTNFLEGYCYLCRNGEQKCGRDIRRQYYNEGVSLLEIWNRIAQNVQKTGKPPLDNGKELLDILRPVREKFDDNPIVLMSPSLLEIICDDPELAELARATIRAGRRAKQQGKQLPSPEKFEQDIETMLLDGHAISAGVVAQGNASELSTSSLSEEERKDPLLVHMVQRKWRKEAIIAFRGRVYARRYREGGSAPEPILEDIPEWASESDLLNLGRRLLTQRKEGHFPLPGAKGGRRKYETLIPS